MAAPVVQLPDEEDIKCNIGISRQEVHCIRYNWIIENFAHVLLDQIGDQINSPDFEDPVTHDTTWRLELSRYYSHKVQLLSLSLRLLRSNHKALNIKCKVCINDANRNNAHIKSFNVPIRKFEELDSLGWWDFISYKDLMENLDLYLLNANLTITCTIYIIGKITNFPSETNYTNMKIPESRLAEDYETLLRHQSASDVILYSDSKEYKCHKAILCARSRVFATMFDTEDKKESIKISGVEEKVLEEMLRYIYTGKVNDIEQIVLQLLYTADQYALDELRAMCEKQVARNISVENAVEVLLYADNHCFKRLKRQAKRFLCSNMKLVMKTNSWKTLASTNARLLNELISYCADHVTS